MRNLIPSRDQFFRPLEEVVNKFYDGIMTDKNVIPFLKSRGGYPRLDILTENGKWIIEVACPGLKSENIDIEIIPDPATDTKLLKIAGKMDDEFEHSDATFFIKELSRSSFERTVNLPSYVKGDPDATMKNGVLRLSWDAPELEEPKSKSIKIKDLG